MALTPTPAARTGGMRVGFVAELVLALALALSGCSAPPSFGGGTEGETRHGGVRRAAPRRLVRVRYHAHGVGAGDLAGRYGMRSRAPRSTPPATLRSLATRARETKGVRIDSCADYST